MRFFDEACRYAGLGWKIFPLIPGSKKPITKHGVHDASDDEDVIGEWARRYPTANIAIACGAKNGIVALDIDKHHGGVETLAALQRKHGELPKAPMAQSPRGGFHLYFAYHPKPVNGANRCGKGLDIKTDGGYLVLPPSFWNGKNGDKIEMEGGGHYRWVRAPRGASLPEMPAWLVKLASPAPVRRLALPKAVEGAETLDPLANFVSLASEGERNSRLYWAACRAAEMVREGKIGQNQSSGRLIEAAQACGLSQFEAQRTVQSALKKVTG